MRLRQLAIAVLFTVALAACTPASSPSSMRVGWQTAWATQGQVIQSMIHTNIPQLYGVKPVFTSFLFGPDLNEAAVTGNIDITNAGIVPVINLLAANDGWIIIGRQIDFLLSVVARNASGVNSVADLKGKRFGIPIAGGSHPYALQLLRENNLPMGDGPDAVTVINVKPSEMPLAIQQGTVDAIATWEPTTSVAVNKGGKVIDERRYVGFICARRSTAQAQPQVIVNLLKCYVEAYYYVAQHRKETDAWFAKASGFDQTLIDKMKVIEPNVQAKTIADVKILVDDADVALAQQVADVMYSAEPQLISTQLQVASRVDMSYAKRALEELASSGYRTPSVSVNPSDSK